MKPFRVAPCNVWKSYSSKRMCEGSSSNVSSLLKDPILWIERRLGGQQEAVCHVVFTSSSLFFMGSEMMPHQTSFKTSRSFRAAPGGPTFTHRCLFLHEERLLGSFIEIFLAKDVIESHAQLLMYFFKQRFLCEAEAAMFAWTWCCSRFTITAFLQDLQEHQSLLSEEGRRPVWPLQTAF